MNNGSLATIRIENALEQQKLCNMIHAFIDTFEPNGIDCMQVSRQLLFRFGLTVNWHDCSSALDMLATNEDISRHGVNDYGNAVYTAKDKLL